ncbi:MAG: Organic hydroperoxide resistance protein OhrB [Stenotrophomonas maltophilia]|uniref:Organic hydroperoxide resistance protein OhrB n=1 Tax=Stenotrophomonas maltophilia TaxID=40324 RepID=A0A7V8JLP9_STEMA|nr:MAG: Organic hydroperoxide resistance protein OhrB [Stenotrophomonas maltophilia]
MSQIDTVLYTGRTHTVGGRNGSARSDDGRLDITLTPPGGSGSGTNPEQLFAAGWLACFMGAIGKAAAAAKIAVPAGMAVDAEVDLGMACDAYVLQVRLQVHLPGIEHAQAETLVAAAHQTCPYSKATHGNIAVTITIA